MTKPRVGLLPFYIKLYDIVAPDETQKFESIYRNAEICLSGHGMEVVTSPVCMVREDFERAFAFFGERNIDAVVTLHLAYSPSMESIDALASSPYPIIVLSASKAYDFGPGQDPTEIMYNHGLAGMQDMCSMLKRRKRNFTIVSGHLSDSCVVGRIQSWAQAALLAGKMRSSRVGVIGGHFEGMGDFYVPSDMLRESIGVESVPYSPPGPLYQSIRDFDESVASETLSDSSNFDMAGVDPDLQRISVRTGLTIRKWIDDNRLTAFTMNFLGFSRAAGFETVPFLEASKAMARGIGYAGEGDALTASLVGTLLQLYPDTMFTEMFCIDWKHDSIFLSHMAEVNPRLVKGRAKLVRMNYIYTDVYDPVIAVGLYRGGEGVLVNLAPAADSAYTLIVAPGEMLDIGGTDNMHASVHGWFKPRMGISEFLEAFSEASGTHHSAFVYGNVASEITRFGRLMGWNVQEIR